MARRLEAVTTDALTPQDGPSVSKFAQNPFIERMIVRNYRGVDELSIEFEHDITVLAGRNNAGKSRIISALHLALGGRPASVDDFTAGSDETPTIDIIVSPATPTDRSDDTVFNKELSSIFEGAVQVVVEDPISERVAWRTIISRSAEGDGARADSHFMLFDSTKHEWVQPTASRNVRLKHRRTFAVDLINTGRDLRDELGRQGSSIRRILSELEIPRIERNELEKQLNNLNQNIASRSGTLRAIEEELNKLQQLVGSIGSPALSPLPASLEELSRLISVDLDTGNGALPIRLHGAGSRSLSSLQLQGILYERRLGKDKGALPPVPITLVEEPEAHLHPQAALELPELLGQMRGQKVVSTHSPQLVTAVAPAAIRLVQTRLSGTNIIDLGPASDDRAAVPRALKPSLYNSEMEKLKRLVERPFGELLFSSTVVLGDGATERAFLPVIIRYALKHRSHGVSVIDTGSLNGDLAKAVVKFSGMAMMPCVAFADSDDPGVLAIKDLEAIAESELFDVVWITRSDAPGDAASGAIESMLVAFDEELCEAACANIRPGLRGPILKRLAKLKGSSGKYLAEELIQRYPDVDTWPEPLQSLVKLLKARA